MEGFYYTILSLWQFINTDFTYGSVAFSLFDVLCAGLILSFVVILQVKLYYFGLIGDSFNV